MYFKERKHLKFGNTSAAIVNMFTSESVLLKGLLFDMRV